MMPEVNDVLRIEMIRDDLESEEKKQLKLEEKTDVKQLLDKQGIERQEVLVSRNGTILTDNHEIKDGDEIRVMDVIAGG
ncbi:MAG: hypothetical protein BRC26_00115 [Nanohaloarchaea archaeon QH_8_44_6]|nr:MAG: hypothetical protein BRC26_00115 [Nanohaloarchaea archaeon QH_8_44_6]